jgi:hypothetical protein
MRDSRALAYLTCVDVRKGLNAGTSALRPEPVTLLKMPVRVPYDVLKRITGTFIPRPLQPPTYTRYDG